MVIIHASIFGHSQLLWMKCLLLLITFVPVQILLFLMTGKFPHLWGVTTIAKQLYVQQFVINATCTTWMIRSGMVRGVAPRALAVRVRESLGFAKI